MDHWKPIPGYPVYEVSKFGSIRNVITGRMLTPYNHSFGYPRVTLYGGTRNKRHICVHTLVLMAFKGPRPVGMEVRHIDGNPRNSTLGNLEYSSHSTNEQDKAGHGTSVRGSGHPNAKLTEIDVMRLKTDRMKGISIRRLALKYGIAKSTAFDIVNGKWWRHVEIVEWLTSAS